MSDTSFAKAGKWAALAAAGFSLAYAVVLAASSRAAGLGSMMQMASEGRVLNIAASWLFAATGIAMTLGLVCLSERGPSHGWMKWAGGLGLVGAALMTVHGLYDAYRVPTLLAQWEMDLTGRRDAISAFAGMPNPVDPKGAASLLFVGLFVLIAAASLNGPRSFRHLGRLHGAVLLAAFGTGAVGFALASAPIYSAYSWLAGLSFAVTGPLWWVAASRVLGSSSD